MKIFLSGTLSCGGIMNSIVQSIVAELDGHIRTLQAAKAAIIQSARDGSQPVHSVQAKKSPKRKKLSAAARKRIGDAQRKRWADQKKAAK